MAAEQGSELKTGLALGLLSAIGPLAIDLYLPAFPTMARDLHASPGEVQRTLSAFFLALAAAQIPIGSLGDRFGRKRPLYLGLAVFVAASIACAFATSAPLLVGLRFVQGFGVCAGTAVSRAMIRDLQSGHRAARLPRMRVRRHVRAPTPVSNRRRPRTRRRRRTTPHTKGPRSLPAEGHCEALARHRTHRRAIGGAECVRPDNRRRPARAPKRGSRVQKG